MAEGLYAQPPLDVVLDGDGDGDGDELDDADDEDGDGDELDGDGRVYVVLKNLVDIVVFEGEAVDVILKEDETPLVFDVAFEEEEGAAVLDFVVERVVVDRALLVVCDALDLVVEDAAFVVLVVDDLLEVVLLDFCVGVTNDV